MSYEIVGRLVCAQCAKPFPPPRDGMVYLMDLDHVTVTCLHCGHEGHPAAELSKQSPPRESESPSGLKPEGLSGEDY